MYKIKYVGSSALVLEALVFDNGEEHLFHPHIFTDADIGRIIVEYGEGDIEFYKRNGEKDESEDLLNRLNNEVNKCRVEHGTGGLGLPETIEAWALSGEEIGHDFKYVRDQISTLAYTKTNAFSEMDNLSDKEKELVCIYVSAPMSFIATQIPNAYDRKDILKAWTARSSTARVMRWTEAKMTVFAMYSELEAKSVLADLTEGNDYVVRYLAGIEGTEEDGLVSLFEYVESRTGTPFENKGIRNGTYTPVQGTNAELADALMTILKDGIYY